MSDKREDYLTWDEYFMGVAMLSGMRSKDPNTQVGCCIVSQDNKILSMGYNGFPKGCSDDEFPWAREGENPLETKYVYSTHSELNAILNYSGGSLVGAKLYVSLFPCNECAKAIIQSGIKEVIYDCDNLHSPPHKFSGCHSRFQSDEHFLGSVFPCCISSLIQLIFCRKPVRSPGFF